MLNAYSAAIVGFGESGRRFFNACKVSAGRRARVNVGGVVDIDQAKLANIPCHSMMTSTSLDEVLERSAFDIIFICTNDIAHFDVFQKLYRYSPRIKRIICEKPIAETLSQANLIAAKFDNTHVAVNFVERYSPIVRNLQTWMASRDLCIKRALFNWSKQRINDARPTMGIFSELSHPLDLVMYMAGIQVGADYRVVNAASIQSSFTRSGAVVPDSVSMAIEFDDNVLVSGFCSYLWSERDRRIVLYLAPRSGPIRYLAKLTFDSPEWGLDRLEIWDLESVPGALTSSATYAIAASDFPAQERGISKICRFVECVVNELDGRRSEEIARLDQALYVQRILSDLGERSGSRHEWLEEFTRGKFQDKIVSGTLAGEEEVSADSTAVLPEFSVMEATEAVVSAESSSI
jgi:predicted dehydrogenase